MDAIKTKGESVAIVLHLLGARPVTEGTGRVARFELIPLDELRPEGRPRVDALCNMSGIFRDSFQNVVELLDDMFQRAAFADEPPERNFVRSVLCGTVANARMLLRDITFYIAVRVFRTARLPGSVCKARYDA